jgi:hypothetical protein
MNIFYLDSNYEQAARWHCDEHVRKMMVEYAQLLSTAHRVLDGTPCTVSKWCYRTKDKQWYINHNYKHYHLDSDHYDHRNILVPSKCKTYLAAHKNHPSTIWARSTIGNYHWLWSLLDQLSLEYITRYTKEHKVSYSGLLDRLYCPPRAISHAPATPVPQCMPEPYKVKDDPVAAYRQFYVKDKSSFASWKYTFAPSWYNV